MDVVLSLLKVNIHFSFKVILRMEYVSETRKFRHTFYSVIVQMQHEIIIYEIKYIHTSSNVLLDRNLFICQDV